jgi:hypothetical protein
VSESLNRAIVVWTGWSDSAWPLRDDARVVAQLGPDEAATLLPQIHSLTDEFYESDARHKGRDLAEMADFATADFRARHPELSDDAVEALAWCYTFDYK